MERADRISGCLLAGAAGDALGAPVEFWSRDEIRARVRFAHRGIVHGPSVLRRAYVRWPATQGEAPVPPAGQDGWLVHVEGLPHRRAPGNTCLAALRGGEVGEVEKPTNRSKGCGGVMRAAPAGLTGLHDPFELGAAAAAVTHGHPTGYLTAGSSRA